MPYSLNPCKRNAGFEEVKWAALRDWLFIQVYPIFQALSRRIVKAPREEYVSKRLTS